MQRKLSAEEQKVSEASLTRFHQRLQKNIQIAMKEFEVDANRFGFTLGDISYNVGSALAASLFAEMAESGQTALTAEQQSTLQAAIQPLLQGYGHMCQTLENPLSFRQAVHVQQANGGLIIPEVVGKTS